MRNKFVVLCLICIISFNFTGCGTIFSKSSDMITFESVPEGARVDINGAKVGVTPVTVPVKRDFDAPQVKIRKDGYESQYVMLQTTFNKIAILNIFFWPGFIIDAVTGALMKYERLSYEVELEKSK